MEDKIKKLIVSRETARGADISPAPPAGCGCERERYGKLGVVGINRTVK